MPIAHYKPDSIPLVEPDKLRLNSDTTRFAPYDNEFDPAYSLEPYLRGSPWTTRAYYSQMLGVADMPKALDLNVIPAFQHYKKIERLDLLTKSALSSSPDNKSQIMSVSGSALVYSFLRPNVFDYFVADSNQGRLGLFLVKNVSRSTHEKMAVHTIDYEMVEELLEDSPKLLNLDLKSSVTVVYSKTRLIENQNPILLKDTYQQTRELLSTTRELSQRWWDTFFRSEKGSFFVPGQEKYIYDPFLTTFVNKVIDNRDVDKQQLVLLSDNNDPLYRIETIWTALAKRGTLSLRHADVGMQLVTPSFFKMVALAKSGFYANTDYILYPRTYDQSTKIEHNPEWLINNDMINRDYYAKKPKVYPYLPCPTTDYKGRVVNPLDYIVRLDGTDMKVFDEVVMGDNSYVFQEDFYKGKGRNLLELLILDYIDRRAIRLERLQVLVDTYPSMGRLEQFYYGPMILTLMKEANRGAYA